jgi:hypothetical protein
LGTISSTGFALGALPNNLTSKKGLFSMGNEELSLFQQALDNWEIIVVSLGASVAALDKFLLVVISSMKNVRDAWYSAFPKKEKYGKPAK